VQRCGELLKEIGKDTPGRPRKNGAGGDTISRKAAAEAADLSDRQRHTALRVASVPKEEFEDAVESDDPPTVTELARRTLWTRPAMSPASATPPSANP
jgi:hypothetical protein